MAQRMQFTVLIQTMQQTPEDGEGQSRTTTGSQAKVGFGAKHAATRHAPPTRVTSTSLRHHTVEVCFVDALSAGMPDSAGLSSTVAFPDVVAVSTGIPAANIATQLPATTSTTVAANGRIQIRSWLEARRNGHPRRRCRHRSRPWPK